MSDQDKRLIEDYLPIEAISEGASGEPRTKGWLSVCSQLAGVPSSSSECCSAVKKTN